MTKAKQLELKQMSWGKDCIFSSSDYAFTLGTEVQLRADQQVLDNVKQAIFDEADKPCNHTHTTRFYGRACDLCWQALRQEWGVK